jgi:hypothetical protein
VIAGVPTRHMVRKPGRSFHSGCGICAKNSVSSGNRPRCVSPSLPPLELNLRHPRASPGLDQPLAPRSGRVQRESEAWEDTTFFLRPTARCVVRKEHRSIHKNDAPNMMGRCACSMPPGLLTVVSVPYARSVKHMARPRKNLVVSALCCIHCLSQCQKSIHLPACLPLIPSCGGIGRAVSLAAPGYIGSEATWSPWQPRPFHHRPRRLLLARALSERIGA